MRLFLLPVSTRRALLYCERTTSSSGGPPSILSRLTTKANSIWVGWERADSGWKRHVTENGNKMLARIPFEEWGLKTLPQLTEKRRRAAKPVDVVFPKLYLEEGRIPEILGTLVRERQALHYKRLIGSVAIMPLTAPFMIVPIIPNLPFFYVLFRAYSHWKAYKGTQHLSHLLSHNLLRPTPSPLLDEAYTAGLMHPSRAVSRDATPPTPSQRQAVAARVAQQTHGGAEDVMVLQRWNGKLLAERFALPEMEVEIERAVEQVEAAIKARDELREEKSELEQAARAAEPGAGEAMRRRDAAAADTQAQAQPQAKPPPARRDSAVETQTGPERAKR